MTIQIKLTEMTCSIEGLFPRMNTSGQSNLDDNKMRVYESIVNDIQEMITEIYVLLTREIERGNFSSSYRLASNDEKNRRHSIVDTLQTLSLAIMTKLNLGLTENVFIVAAYQNIEKICAQCYAVDILLLETSHYDVKNTIAKGLATTKSYTDYKTKSEITLSPGLTQGQIMLHRSPLAPEIILQIKTTLFVARSELDPEYTSTEKQTG